SPIGRPSPSPLVGHLILLMARHPFSRVVDPIGIDTGVNPAATSSGPIGGHLVKGLQRLASFWHRSIETVNLYQNGFGIWLAVLFDRIISCHSLQLTGTAIR